MDEQITDCGHYGLLYKGQLHKDLASVESAKKAEAESVAIQAAQERKYWAECMTVSRVIEKLRELPQDAKLGVIDDDSVRGLIDAKSNPVFNVGDITVVII